VPTHDILLASPCCQGHAKARGKKDQITEDELLDIEWIHDDVTIEVKE